MQDILTVEFEALHHHTARELDKIMNFIGLKGKIDPNLSLNADARVHFEIKFSAHYTHQLSTLTNRLKPYINSYPPFC